MQSDSHVLKLLCQNAFLSARLYGYNGGYLITFENQPLGKFVFTNGIKRKSQQKLLTFAGKITKVLC
ncbi:hypothetical protein DW064_05915 [Segatella copri]|uniref:Uncharacterized protein n=1 Tax=Segatella copri TaxID=165179 RepID=A0AA92V8B6_9BACT|nr:hypothetical protein DW064_05915 [Segatella copri]